MFKILVVDDEKIVLDAVKYILDKNFEGQVVYEIARSGREAIEKADEFNPDIIMMDIRMPGINGIDAIKEIKSKKPRTHFIIVSAYEQFDFAKEAVELKVDDYILKPIIKSKLVNVLQSIMDKIEADKLIKKKELENLEKYEQITPFLEQNFIYSIVLGGCSDRQLEQYRNMLELNEESGYIFFIEKLKYSIVDRKENENGLIGKEDYYSVLCDALKCKCRCIIGPEIENKVVAFIITTEKTAKVLESEATEIADYLIKRIKSSMEDSDIKVGIGNYRELNELTKSFEEALLASKYITEANKAMHINNILVREKAKGEEPKELENRLLEQVSEGNLEGAMTSFNRIYKWIYSNYETSFEAGRAKLGEIFVMVHKTAFSRGVKQEDYTDYLFELIQNEDHFKLQKWCSNRLIDILHTINILHNRKNSRIITGAKEYIYENYFKDITLEEAAKEVAVTPHYLSRLFKEETGQNFIEYLTTYRIKKAKNMMDTTNLNIKEICFKIGYTDPNYFSRLFKKVEKVTPTDYMNNSKKS